MRNENVFSSESYPSATAGRTNNVLMHDMLCTLTLQPNLMMPFLISLSHQSEWLKDQSHKFFAFFVALTSMAGKTATEKKFKPIKGKRKTWILPTGVLWNSSRTKLTILTRAPEQIIRLARTAIGMKCQSKFPYLGCNILHKHNIMAEVAPRREVP